MMETLYYGGTIDTMEPGRTAQAVLVRDDVIAAVGTLEEVSAAAGPKTLRRNLDGACLIPALIDAHSHLCSYAQSLRLCDLSQAHCMDDIIASLRRQPPSGGWIVGFGYDHSILSEGRHPARKELDQVSKELPVLVTHASGHMGAVNTAALAQMGIDRTTPNPDGGIIARQDDGETPNGFLEENAFFTAGGCVPPATEQEMRALLRRAEQIYLSHGIATAQEGLAKEAEMSLLRTSDLTLDVVAYIDQKDHAALLEQYRDHVGRYQNHLKVGGYKIFLDGSPQGRTAWLSAPYLGENRDYAGYPALTDQQVAFFVEQAEREGVQLLAHCNGDRAAEQFLAAHSHPSRHRDVMIHAQLLRRDQLEEVKRLGILPSFFVSHTYYWGDVHIQNLGSERASVISPAGSAARMGIPFTLHADTPVLPPDLLDCLWCATQRETRQGVRLAQEEALSVTQALRALTLDGAYQYFEETVKGSIRVGKYADFALLSAPLYDGMSQDEIRKIEVLETIRRGQTVFAR